MNGAKFRRGLRWVPTGSHLAVMKRSKNGSIQNRRGSKYISSKNVKRTLYIRKQKIPIAVDEITFPYGPRRR